MKNINIKNKKYFFEKFDVTDLKNTKKNIEILIKKKGIPDIFINASYPRTKDWAQNNFKNIKLKSLQQNINMFMNSYVWSAKCIADKMTVNSKKKSIILVGSIYGKVGQNTFNYVGTEMKENYSYSIIKEGSIVQHDKWLHITANLILELIIYVLVPSSPMLQDYQKNKIKNL